MGTIFETGGPAFPRSGFELEEHTSRVDTMPQYGMTLRDYFAAKAIHAELVTCGQDTEAADAMVKRAKRLGVNPVRHMANNAYEVADAMLQARKSMSDAKLQDAAAPGVEANA